MRRSLLLLAALPLLFAPPAFADDETPAERPSVCRVPDVELSYDTETFTALFSLPASGCKSREHRIFTLSAMISRLDHEDGRDATERSVHCGPFRSADDVEPGDAEPNYSCDLAVFLAHPTTEENAQYDLEVTYPGAAAERTLRLFTFCTSDGKTASCEE
jgi:hypothetical protein